MRRTAGVKFYRGCKNIYATMNFLGHRDIGTTMIYTSVLGENTREAIELSPLNDLFISA